MGMSRWTGSYPDGNGNSHGSRFFPFVLSRFLYHRHAEERGPCGRTLTSTQTIGVCPLDPRFPRPIISRYG